MIVIRVPDDRDHPFRADRNQLIGRPGMVITMPRNVFHRAEWRWTSQKASYFSDLTYGRRQRADQEIVYAQDQGSSTPPL
jgi:hypothetical protein